MANNLLTKTNIFFLLGLSISIPASKAGMNAFLYLYVLSSMLMLTQKNIILSDTHRRLLKGSVGVFLVGGLLAFFSKGSDNDSLVYMQKYAYLLVPIALVITTKHNAKVLQWSVLAFMLSVGVCLLIDIYLFSVVYDFFKNGAVRIWGQIGYSRWPIVVVTAISIALIAQLNTKLGKRTLALMFAVIAGLFGLALSGTKGGIVAVAILGMFYLAIQARKHWLIIPAALVLIFISINTSTYEKAIGHRFSYETITTSNSTLERIAMLKTGVAITKHNLANDYNYFLFGGGIDKPEIPYQAALESLDESTLQHISYNGKLWGHTDLHNSYFDQLLKSGLLFSIIFYSLVILMVVQGYYAVSQSKKLKYLPTMYFGTLSAYVVFNCFYSNFSDYAIYSQIYFLGLAIALPIALEGDQQTMST